jgi:hypothetical protein
MEIFDLGIKILRKTLFVRRQRFNMREVQSAVTGFERPDQRLGLVSFLTVGFLFGRGHFL